MHSRRRIALASMPRVAWIRSPRGLDWCGECPPPMEECCPSPASTSCGPPAKAEDDPGPVAVERHDHHHRCERSRRRDYLRSRRCGPGVLVTSHDRHVRHMRIGRGNAREQGCADDVTDLRQSDVSRTVAGHLVGPPRQPTRDRRIGDRFRGRCCSARSSFCAHESGGGSLGASISGHGCSAIHQLGNRGVSAWVDGLRDVSLG